MSATHLMDDEKKKHHARGREKAELTRRTRVPDRNQQRTKRKKKKERGEERSTR